MLNGERRRAGGVERFYCLKFVAFVSFRWILRHSSGGKPPMGAKKPEDSPVLPPLFPVVWAKSALPYVNDIPAKHAPHELWTAATEDGGQLQALIWGRGVQHSPYHVNVRYRATRGRARFPTWEECYQFLHALAAPGTLFTLPPFDIDPEGLVLFHEALADPDMFPGLTFQQIGHVPGTEAAANSLIFAPGGRNREQPTN